MYIHTSWAVRRKNYNETTANKFFKKYGEVSMFNSDVWLTVHRNSVWIRKTN